MAYQWDVFLSYKRSNDWPAYIEKHFLPKLQHWLDTALGRTSKIFVDVHEIETGEEWPYQLAHALAHSKVMVCLWSKEYFSSKWCALELTQMLARRKSLTGPSGAPPSLILGVLIHDSENLDHALNGIQKFALQKYASPWIAEGSLTAERLSEEIERLAGHLVKALVNAPEYDDSWPNLVTAEFMRMFEEEVIQDLPPSLGRVVS